MTLSDLRALSASDSASPDPRRRKAGEWAAKALAALEKKDWTGASVAIAHAIIKSPDDYIEAFFVVPRAKGGAGTKGLTSPKKAASSRENGKLGAQYGKLGGRPRKYPLGTKPPRQSTRKPGETRGRKPKAANQDNEKKTEE